MVYYPLESSMLQGEAGEALTISPGMWLCECCLWTAWVHMGALEATSHCEILSIDAKQFAMVCQAHQKVFRGIVNYANAYVYNLNTVDGFGTSTTALVSSIQTAMSDLADPEQLEAMAAKAFPDTATLGVKRKRDMSHFYSK